MEAVGLGQIEKVPITRYSVFTACVHARLYSDLLVREHISIEQATFSKCFL